MDIPVPDHQFKVPVVQRPGYTLSLERATPSHTFIHCDVHGRWGRTPSPSWPRTLRPSGGCTAPLLRCP
jgi:hypothetical protein